MTGQSVIMKLVCVLCISFAGVVLGAWDAVDFVLPHPFRVMEHLPGTADLSVGNFILRCAGSDQ